MRDPDRIKRILNMLTAYWQAYPDLRFGQLLCNIGYFEFPPNTEAGLGVVMDPYHYEDDRLEECLKKALKQQ